MNKDIKSIVLSAMSGDKDAYGKLYEYYSNDMYRFALGLCKNTYDAQDAVQDTAVSVFKSMHSLKNPDKFKSYLFCALSNTCKRILSKNNYIVEFEDTGERDRDIEFSLPVREALDKLDSTSREIVLLSVVGGFKSHEIGKMTDMTSATVRTKLRRALIKLRKELE
ncbi:MAG: RNA polymerase sigma factor [Clostridia bacterium]|nr:RNA polymerase sigma factor [Clostridia bacterium]